MCPGPLRLGALFSFRPNSCLKGRPTPATSPARPIRAVRTPKQRAAPESCRCLRLGWRRPRSGRPCLFRQSGVVGLTRELLVDIDHSVSRLKRYHATHDERHRSPAGRDHAFRAMFRPCRGLCPRSWRARAIFHLNTTGDLRRRPIRVSELRVAIPGLSKRGRAEP